jgi:cytochrome c6
VGGNAASLPDGPAPRSAFVADDAALLAGSRRAAAGETQGLRVPCQRVRSQSPPETAYWPGKKTKASPMNTRSKILLLSAPLLAIAAISFAAPAAENWENHCAKCHGADGKGQTKAGKKLQVKDYTDAKVQAEMKDEEMIKATTDGVTDKNGKERMKAFKDELSGDEIKDLVAYIRKFKA